MLVSSGQEFTQRARVFCRHRLLQSGGGLFDYALVVILLFGLAIGEEAPSLVEMKQRAADVRGGEGAVERLGAQLIGIECLKRLAVLRIRRHQSVADQCFHQVLLPIDKTVAPLACATSGSAVDRVGSARLRIATIRKHPHAARTEAGWPPAIAVAFQPDYEPAE